MNLGRGQIQRGEQTRSLPDRSSDDEIPNLIRDYDFVDRDFLYDDITFSRGAGTGGATQTNSSGLVAYAPHNYYIYSENFGHSDWSKQSLTITADTSVTDPFGGTGSFKAVKQGSLAYQRVYDGVVRAGGAGDTYTLSVYVKPTTSLIGLAITYVGANDTNQNITVTPNVWQRVSYTLASTGSYSSIVPWIYPCGSSGDDDSSSGGDAHIFGAQFESNFLTEPTTYNKTTGSAYQAPRFDYDKDGNSKGLLIEEGRTNFVPYGQDLSHTDWVKYNASVSASNEIDPTGGTGAYKFAEASTASNSKLMLDAFTASSGSGTVYTWSVYAKKAELDILQLILSAVTYAGGDNHANFNLSTGQVTATGGGATANIQECKNGWYRCSITDTTSATGVTQPRIGIQNSPTAARDGAYTGNGTDGIFIFGGQGEEGSFPTSLIPTYGADADRAADLVKVDSTNFSRFFKDTEGTIVVDAQVQKGWASPIYSRIYYAVGDSTGERYDMHLAGNTFKVYTDIKTGNVSQGSHIVSDTIITSGEISSLAQVYKANDHKSFQDGVLGATDTGVTLPTGVNKIHLGGAGATHQLCGWIRRFRYYNKRQSDNKIKSLTDTSFLLDKYKGAKAAHSLRSLRDGRDNTPVARVRRDYDSYEADYTANQISNGDLEADFQSSKQTTLPLDVSCDASELITNGTFGADSDWTKGTGWTIGSGVASSDGTQSGNSNFYQTGVHITGKAYTLTFDLTATNGEDIKAWVNGTQNIFSSALATGNHTYTYTAEATGTMLFEATAAFVGSIDNVSVKEVSPLATGFSTRKINSSYTGKAMRCRNQGNVEVEVGFDDNDEISLLSPITNTSQNLLGFSENFGEWTLGSTPERVGGLADPFGGNNAWSLKSTTAAYHNISLSGITITANSTHTFSWYVKKEATRTNFGGVALNLAGGTSKWAHIAVDETNGTATSFETTTNTPHISITEPVTGWYRVAVTLKDTHSNTTAGMYFYSGFSSNGTSLSSVTGSARTIFGAQLEETLYEDTGTEKITNGDFDTDTGWDVSDAGWNVADGKLNFSGSSNGWVLTDPDVNAVVDKTYRLSFEVSDFTSSGWNNISFGGSHLAISQSSAGSYSYIITATSTARLAFYGTGGADFSLDNISLKEVSPEVSNYAQTPVVSDDDSSTTATTLGGFSGLENKLTYSEDFSNGVWTKSGVTATSSNITDPLGGTNSFAVIEDTANSTHALIRGTRPTIQAGVHTLSLYLKSNGKTVGRLLNNGTSGAGRIVFDLTNKTTTVESGPVVGHSITELDNGWFRVSMDFTAVTGTSGISVYLQGTGGSWTGDGESGFYVFGMQVNTNSLKTYQATTGTALTGDVNVVNWYDQNGGEDAVNAVAGEQPRIVMGSELVTDSGGKPSIYFDGGDSLRNDSLAGQNRLDSYYSVDTDDDAYVYPAQPTGSSAYGIFADDGSSNSSLSVNYGSPTIYNNGSVLTGNQNAIHDALKGHHVVSHVDASTTSFASFGMGWYSTGSTASNFTGKISEMVFFPNMDSSPKRFPIEQNMLNHFDIANLIDEPFTVDPTTGGAGGYGASNTWLKNDSGGSSTVVSHETASPINGTGSMKIAITGGSSSGYPRVKKDFDYNFKTGIKYSVSFKTKVVSGTAEFDSVRFGTASSNMKFTESLGLVLSGEQTHTFTQTFDTVPSSGGDHFQILFDGTSTTGTILVDDLVIKEVGFEGFVTKLYDQTGNNCHATQDTASYQPKLVAGGDLITSGGKPAWLYPIGNPQRNLIFQGVENKAHIDAFFVQDVNAESQFMVPSSSSTSYYGFAAHDGSTSTTKTLNYAGNLEVNGTDADPCTDRGDVYDAIVGRKLVYHRDAVTTNWPNVQIGWWGTSDNGGWNIEGLKFSEIIWYDSDQHSNQSGIESNINTHYNIY